MPNLTADICARGVIAAAQYLGYDPIKAAQAQRGPLRTAVTAAAVAAQRFSGRPRGVVARIYDVQPNSLARCERVSTKGFDRACERAEAAMMAAASVQPAEALPPATVRAPAWEINTVAGPAPAPVLDIPPAPKVDHMAAIREAMKRREGAARAPVRSQSMCDWPNNLPGQEAEPLCRETRVQGRLFCPKHCRAVGQKDTPVALSAPELPRSYRDPRAENAIGRGAR
jgi:hypothetical protein